MWWSQPRTTHASQHRSLHLHIPKRDLGSGWSNLVKSCKWAFPVDIFGSTSTNLSPRPRNYLDSCIVCVGISGTKMCLASTMNQVPRSNHDHTKVLSPQCLQVFADFISHSSCRDTRTNQSCTTTTFAICSAHKFTESSQTFTRGQVVFLKRKPTGTNHLESIRQARNRFDSKTHQLKWLWTIFFSWDSVVFASVSFFSPRTCGVWLFGKVLLETVSWRSFFLKLAAVSDHARDTDSVLCTNDVIVKEPRARAFDFVVTVCSCNSIRQEANPLDQWGMPSLNLATIFRVIITRFHATPFWPYLGNLLPLPDVSAKNTSAWLVDFLWKRTGSAGRATRTQSQRPQSHTWQVMNESGFNGVLARTHWISWQLLGPASGKLSLYRDVQRSVSVRNVFELCALQKKRMYSASLPIDSIFHSVRASSRRTRRNHLLRTFAICFVHREKINKKQKAKAS